MTIWGVSAILSPFWEVSKRLDIDFLVCGKKKKIFEIFVFLLQISQAKKTFFQKIFFAEIGIQTLRNLQKWTQNGRNPHITIFGKILRS